MAANSNDYSALRNDEVEQAWGSRSSLDDSTQGSKPEAVHLASREEKRRLWWRSSLKTCIFIGGWFFFAILLSVYNKWMFSPDKFGFPFPLFVTSQHMWVQFTLAAVVRYSMPQRFKPKNNPQLPDYMKKAVPAAISTALDIGLGNWSLKLITLSLYTMVKSSTLIFVLIFAFLFHLEVFSIRLILVIFLIFIGVILTVAAETEVVIAGVALVLTASASSGLRWSLAQVILRTPRMGMNNPAATLFWLSPSMGITLTILSLAIDGWGNVFATPFFQWERLPVTIFCLIFPGILAFCMVLSEYYIVQRAGVVPLSIAGTFKEVTTLSVSAWLFGDHLNPINISGVAITFLGMGLYTYHKYLKTMESTIPLDAHGNPISADEDEVDASSEGIVKLPRDGESDERQALRTSGDNANHHISTTPSAHVLFSAGDLTEFERSETPRDIHHDGGGAHGATGPYRSPSERVRLNDSAVARESFEAEREWDAQGSRNR